MGNPLASNQVAVCPPAPVEKGQKAGVLRYRLGDTVLGELPVVTERAVEKAGIGDCLKQVWKWFLLERAEA